MTRSRYAKTRPHEIDGEVRRLRMASTARRPPDRPFPEPARAEIIWLRAGNGRAHEVEAESAAHRHLVENHAAVEIDRPEGIA